MKKPIGLIVLLGIISFQSNAAGTQERPDSVLIRQCNAVNLAIEKYTKLKRKGGNSQQMNSWHKKRNEHKKRYSQLDCKRVRQYLD